MNSVVTNNIVHVIYPDEFTAGFVIATQSEVDPHDILESVFAQWNNGSGQESELFIRSRVRSLSVNDIVCVNGNYYQCASFGWNEVTAEYVNELEQAVANHPSRNEGAWFALNDVMWKNRKKNVDASPVA